MVLSIVVLFFNSFFFITFLGDDEESEENTPERRTSIRAQTQRHVYSVIGHYSNRASYLLVIQKYFFN